MNATDLTRLQIQVLDFGPDQFTDQKLDPAIYDQIKETLDLCQTVLDAMLGVQEHFSGIDADDTEEVASLRKIVEQLDKVLEDLPGHGEPPDVDTKEIEAALDELETRRRLANDPHGIKL